MSFRDVWERLIVPSIPLSIGAERTEKLHVNHDGFLGSLSSLSQNDIQHRINIDPQSQIIESI